MVGLMLRESHGGLEENLAREWGYPRLKKTRSEYTYCACGLCEGHETVESGALFKFVSNLGKGEAHVWA